MTKQKVSKRERLAANKKAFDEIIGDPYSKEDLPGQYITARTSSSLKSVSNYDATGPSTKNAAKPNLMDFICDVESAIDDGLMRFRKDFYGERDVFPYFVKTYIIQTEEAFKQQERATLEQIIGQIFIARNISPVSKYFTAIRRKNGR
jgi:hypothetical protein